MTAYRHAGLIAVAAVVMAVAGPGGASAQLPLGGDTRTDLALTVYGNGLGMVVDRRRADLSKGINSLALEGLSPQIIADSLVTSFGGGVRVLARERRVADLTPRKMMQANVGKAGYLIRIDPRSGVEIAEPATLLSMQGGVIARIGERVVVNPQGRWAFDGVPDGLRPRPALLLSASAPAAGPHELSLSYLTGGMSWRPVYTAQWRADSGRLGLQSWAVLTNKTGVDFDQAWISLVAGQVHRVGGPVPAPRQASAMNTEAAMVGADTASPSRKQLAGYHLYKLPAAADLPDGAEVQVPLMERLTVKADRQLISEGYPQAFGAARGKPEPTHPTILLSFVVPNGDAAQPLPSGTLRLYGPDRQGAARFLGEDRLDDIPIGGKAMINAGRAFDVTVTRSQTAFKRESRQVFESAHEVRLLNGGTEPATVTVIENLPGDWTVLEADRDPDRDGGRARWMIDVPAGGNAVLTYRVRVRN